jgi:hypothetical protein
MSYRRYRTYRNSRPTVRAITVKYEGNCMCCGGKIQPGQIADFYPVGTIAGVHEGRLAHLKATEGNSVACATEFKREKQSGEHFDYEKQAWVGADGRYLRCGHPAAINCQCYGRVHQGELAPAKQDSGLNNYAGDGLDTRYEDECRDRCGL